MKNAAVVFVHGLFSSSRTWDPLIGLLESTNTVSEAYDLIPFEYESPKWNINPARRIPNFSLIATTLKTFLDTTCGDYRAIVLIAHSQGGLVVQRYLTQMLDDGRGRELARISRVILLACPNNGSEFAWILRRAVGWFWHHPQEHELRPYADSVADTHHRVINRIVYANSISSDSCPITFRVYAGQSDNIVTPASARSTFPEYGALPGDHNSILHANSMKHGTYAALKTNLLEVLRESSKSMPRLVSEPFLPSLSPEGDLEYRRPPTRVTEIPIRSGSTALSETETFDQSPAGQFIQQSQPSGEEADVDG